MNLGTLCEQRAASSIGWEWLRAELEPLSDYGDRVFSQIVPFEPGEEEQAGKRAELIAALDQTLSAQRLDTMRELLRTVPDASAAFARASMGDALTDVQFLELQRFCDTIGRMRTAAAQTPLPSIDACEAVARALERGRAGSFGFYLADDYDGQLGAARARLSAAQAEYDAARGRLTAAIAQKLGREQVASDEFIVMRDDLQGALPEGIHVIREAPTYLLCAVELDEGSLAALGRRDALASQVALAEERARFALSAIVREHAVALERAATTLGEIDVLLAAVRFCKRLGCSAARYQREPSISFRAACFPPVAQELDAQNRAYTPIDAQISEVAVLTGPNMGGKTVALQTAGFLALCAAFGLPVPAAETTTCIFARIAWLGIGAREELGGLLSSFAREIVQLRAALDGAFAPALFLIDEFARTTNPEEGRALLLALIARLKERRICAFIATHLGGIARAAGSIAYRVTGLRDVPAQAPEGDLSEALMALAASMDYRISVTAGDGAENADAIVLARLLGMDAAFIERAWQELVQPAEKGR